MPQFTVRVLLHFPPEGGYDILHREMRALGFSKTIRNPFGGTIRLPPGEYNFEGDRTADQVNRLARYAARTVCPLHMVLVSEAVNRVITPRPLMFYLPTLDRRFPAQR